MTPGRLLIGVGLALACCGLLWELGFRVGRLPGDFVWRGRQTTFYFPLATSLLLSVALSVVLSVVFWLLSRRL